MDEGFLFFRIYGESDKPEPRLDARGEAQALIADAIPNSRVHIFTRAERDPDADPNNRHWSQVSHSRAWNRVVTEFLAEVEVP